MIVGVGDDVAFEVRLSQTIAWCAVYAEVKDPARSLRHDELNPRLLERNRSEVVRHALRTREQIARGRVRAIEIQSARAAVIADDVKGGRLLVYFPDAEIADGASEEASLGFLDVHDAPPIDTWVGLFRDERINTDTHPERYEFLLSWVPTDFVPLVEDGLAVNAVDSIVWLSNTRLKVAHELHTLGLLT
jgi:hypothetical protein